jgi:hypothetical protein
MKCKRKKAELGAAAIAAILSAVATGIGTATQLKQAATNRDNELLKQRYDNMSESAKNSQLFAGNLQSFYNNQDAVQQRKNDLVLPTLNNSQFKCGGSRYYKRPKALLGSQDDANELLLNTIKYFNDRHFYEQTGLMPKETIKYLPLKQRIVEKRKWEDYEAAERRRKQDEKFYNGDVYNSKLYQKLDNFDNKYLNNMILPTKNMRKGSTYLRRNIPYIKTLETLE